MQTASISNQNFGASLISKVPIKHKVKGRWQDKSVSFIKFDTNKRRDREALKEVSRLWNGDNFSASIAEEADILHKNSHVYGITLQEAPHSYVDSNKVLGLITTDKIEKGTKEVEIYRMGVIPEFAHGAKRNVKHVGTALLEGLQKLLNKNSDNPAMNITLDSDRAAAKKFFANAKENSNININAR